LKTSLNWEGKQTSRSKEVQKAPNNMNPRRSTPRHITIKMSKIKDKERTLKATREKQKLTYKGNPIFQEKLEIQIIVF